MSQKPDAVAGVETSTQLTSPSKNDKKKVTAVDNGVEKKKRRGISILKVAMFLLRRRSGKSNAVDVASKGLWKRVVGSMRPLHLQSNQSPEQNLLPPSTVPDPQLLSSPARDHFEDVFSPPFSPNAPKSSSSSSVDGMSRYASAVNLQELDQIDDEDDDSDNEREMNMNGGDEMIDAKAEKFISQFYAQMRLQRSDSVLRYNEMIKRSIG